MVDYSKLKKGQKFIRFGEMYELLTKPKYESDSTSGLFYADVRCLDDNEIIRHFMICRTDIEWLEVSNTH